MFDGIDKKFNFELASFAATGHRFNDVYSLYKQSQQEAFQGFAGGLAKGDRHGYIELPTGVGKTALFIALILNYLKAVTGGGEHAPRVLIAVPTEKLAVQTAKAFAKFIPDIAKLIETDGDEGQEIDWEKSDIGLQYGKMKHAHKKPKVLITTYQSLARDKENKIYSPEEYGFVVYDEGHAITAPTFGKAVAKFKNSIQLAVTATPEYSEIKTVAELLPRCYYRLSLADAMNRNDLCNVRPAIIKTGYRIDEELFNDLMNQQNRRPLRDDQLEKLLNQEARNQSVIQTYLRGADSDSGERYFGQNGMVFCTGVKHADMITAQFRQEMEKGDGLALGQWLDREGLELIAAIHGKTKGAWLRPGMLPDADPVTRKYQDDKEWYSEAEIDELHNQGKILLLASVAKLKWGADYPRDSLLFDLADRFSKLEATQIDGRVFRLDPEDPDKTATVFNLRDENTEELYDKHPELIPIYCAEVIEGAKFRTPGRRIGAHIRFKEPPPEMEGSLQQAGFEVISDIDAVRAVSNGNKARRNEAKKKFPPKEAGWVSNGDMMLVYVGTTTGFRSLLKSHAETLQHELIQRGQSPEEANKFVDENFISWRTVGSKTAICASPESIVQLEQQGKLQFRSQQAPEREFGWLSNNDMTPIYVGDASTFKSLLKAYAEILCHEFVQQGKSPEEAATYVDKYFVGLRTIRGKEALCASPNAIAQLEQEGKLRPSKRAPFKESGWLSNEDMTELYVGDRATFKLLLDTCTKTLRQEFIQQGMTTEEASIWVDKHFIGMRMCSSKTAICASPDAIAQLEQQDKLRLRSDQPPSKELDWLSNKAMEQSYAGTPKNFKFLLKNQAETLQQEFIHQGQPQEVAEKLVNKHYIGIRSVGSQTAICASPKALSQLEQQGKLRRRELVQATRPKTGKKPSTNHRPSGTGE